MRRRYFLRRAGIFFAIMMIPTILVIGAFSFLNIRSVEKGLGDNGLQTVEAVKSNFDLVINNLLTQNDLLTGTTRMSLSLRRVLDRDLLNYGDSIYISSLRSVMRSLINTHTYIDSIYIYLDTSGRYFSSEGGVSYVEVENTANWLAEYRKMDSEANAKITLLSSARGAAGEMETLTIIKRLLMQKGCTVVNVNPQKLKEILSKLFSNDREAIYLIGEQGETLLFLSKLAGAQPLPEGFLVQNMGNDGRWISENDTSFLMQKTYDEQMGIYIVSLTERAELTAGLTQLMGTFLMILLVDIVVVMALAYITTKRSFDQIEYMIDVFDDAERGLQVKRPDKKAHDEYDVIMNNIIYLFLNNNYLNGQLKEEQFQKKLAELMSLQLQINPHFLFNTLQTVDIEVRKNGEATAYISAIVRNVSKILKYALSDPQEKVTIREEISYLKKYIAVQKFRFGDAFVIYYEVDAEVEDASVFRLMLQPLVENSLLHGVRGLDEKGYMNVSILRDGDKLHCKVSDTGIGMDEEELCALQQKIDQREGPSIGLTNLNRRLILRYGEEGALSIRSEKGKGTTVFFTIPYEKAGESIINDQK